MAERLGVLLTPRGLDEVLTAGAVMFPCLGFAVAIRMSVMKKKLENLRGHQSPLDAMSDKTANDPYVIRRSCFGSGRVVWPSRARRRRLNTVVAKVGCEGHVHLLETR
jgi:hypothetical protein